MQKVKIRLPATIVNLGPMLQGAGLALALYTHVEVTPRTDDALMVEMNGESAGCYPVGLRHPVVLALGRVFQRLEKAPPGLQIRIENQIPVGSGLGVETAFSVAGVIAANNLMGTPYPRDEALAIAAQISRADSAVSTVFGGLTLSHLENERLTYRSLSVAPLTLAVVLPEIANYAPPLLGDRIPTAEMLQNLSRSALLLEAFKAGDLKMIARMIQDDVYVPRAITQIPAYAAVAQAAIDTGALAVTVAGDGPALIALAENAHQRVAQAMVDAFAYVGVRARSWVLPVDRQGITLSLVSSS